jgi:hypothetical protein
LFPLPGHHQPCTESACGAGEMPIEAAVRGHPDMVVRGFAFPWRPSKTPLAD